VRSLFVLCVSVSKQRAGGGVRAAPDWGDLRGRVGVHGHGRAGVTGTRVYCTGVGNLFLLVFFSTVYAGGH
jgi:hypothetical protein